MFNSSCCRKLSCVQKYSCKICGLFQDKKMQFVGKEIFFYQVFHDSKFGQVGLNTVVNSEGFSTVQNLFFSSQKNKHFKFVYTFLYEFKFKLSKILSKFGQIFTSF